MCLSGKKAERRLVIRIVPRASLSPLSHRSPPSPTTGWEEPAPPLSKIPLV